MRSLKIIAALLAASLVAVPVFANPKDGRTPSAEHAKKSPAERAANREKRRSAALKDAGVDASRTRQALDVMKRFDAQRAPILKQMREDFNKLRELRQAKNKDKDAAQAIRKDMKANRDKLRAIEKSESAALSQILKPAELAKLQQSMRSGKRGHGGKHGKHGKHGQRAQERNG